MNNKPEPTELEKAIEHIENLRIAQRAPWSTVYCNMVSLGKVLSAAKRTQQAEQQLKDMTDVAKKLAKAIDSIKYDAECPFCHPNEPCQHCYEMARLQGKFSSLRTLAKQAKLLWPTKN